MTVSAPPWTRLKTPGGRPISAISRAMRIPLNGVRSDGLRMNVLPAAIAMGSVQNGTMSGKLNGVMAAHTPTGYRSIIVSMPRLTDSTL